MKGYRQGRDRPDLGHVSRLSPHLHFGEISPNRVWHAVLPLQFDASMARDVDSFLSEIGWREFSRYLLWHFPSLPEQNLQEKFDRFPWQDDADALERWRRGMTGIPIVDAAPYFRIFNPLTQAGKFDPNGDYVRRFVPELESDDYPEPIVDLKASRRRALDAFGSIS